ncbi:hypothetical protein AB0B45_19670 [Nonomuraea sp. NPDC049152]|uniref:hypothetical protein n=1 Tax=Nonomuraea sp. NPDC049152 TaxID=3154350 RepID=UPI0033D8C207
MTTQDISPPDTRTPPVSQSEPVERQGTQSGVLALIERIGSVIVPIGVALYAVLYIGVEQMYAVFGISPQQAGIDQSVLLGRLTGTLVLLFLIVLPLIGAAVAAGWVVDKLTRGALSRLIQGDGAGHGWPPSSAPCGAARPTGAC